jgi:hypothetical protein
MAFIKRFSLFLLLVAMSSTTSFAQKVNLDQFKSWKPRNIGPAGMSGRITAIDAVVADPNTIYLGAASGGVWQCLKNSPSSILVP